MIVVDNLTVCAGQFALRNISFKIPAGQYAFLMGKTGSGKTTLLEAICGLKSVVAGHIWLQDVDVTHLKPAQRGIGFVPQDAALFSTMTVREHLAFALSIRHWAAPAIEARVTELADWLGLKPLLGRKPAGLSGGEMQRVALGRALSFRPSILCLDEPLSALDEDTRAEMWAVLKSIRQHTVVTILHITHSLDEATKLADQILLIKDGQVFPA